MLPAGQPRRVGHLEPDPAAQPCLGGRLAGAGNRGVVGVDAQNARARERLRDGDRRRPVAAADIGHQPSRLQPGHHPVERSQPAGQRGSHHRPADQVHASRVGRAVLVPADPAPGAERLLVAGQLRPLRRRLQAGPLDQAAQRLTGHHRHHRRGQAVTAGGRLIHHVAGRRLGPQPLPHVRLRRRRPGSQLPSGSRPGGQRFPQPDPHPTRVRSMPEVAARSAMSWPITSPTSAGPAPACPWPPGPFPRVA